MMDIVKEISIVFIIISGAFVKSENNECGLGTFSSSGVAPCTVCPVGSYQNGLGKSYCKSCKDDKITLHNGAKKASDCLAVNTTLYHPQLILEDFETGEQLGITYDEKTLQPISFLSDPITGVYVNGRLETKTKNGTKIVFFTDVAIMTDEAKILFTDDHIELNGIPLAWVKNRIIESQGITVVSLPNKDSFSVELLDGNVTFTVVNNRERNEGYYFGINKLDGLHLPKAVSGILGQFVIKTFHLYQRLAQSYGAVAAFWDGTIYIPVRSAACLNPTLAMTQCWIPERTESLFERTADFIVKHISFK